MYRMLRNDCTPLPWRQASVIKEWCIYDWEKQQNKHPQKSCRQDRQCSDTTRLHWTEHILNVIINAPWHCYGCTALLLPAQRLTTNSMWPKPKKKKGNQTHNFILPETVFTHITEQSDHQWFWCQNHVSTGRISTFNYDTKSLGMYTT